MVKLYLSRLLGERRMTQAELSRITGIRPNTVNDIYHETAERISLDHLDRICEALNCDLHDLLTRTPNPVPKTGISAIWEPHANQKSK